MQEKKQQKIIDGKPCISLPSSELPVKPKSRKEFEKETRDRVERINKEFQQTFEFLRQFPKTVTFFGSARFKEDTEHYKQAERIAKRICELGFVVITGGGPGIMEAANKGAKNACGTSVGLNIELPNEQNVNDYVTDHLSFQYFFSRKVALAFSAEAYLFFPGGFGTLDEFFEIITLVQTNKIKSLPIILVGEDYWRPLDNFIQKNLFEEHQSINEEDRNLYHITDDEDHIVEVIKNAPSRDE